MREHHTRIGDATRSISEHGAVMEHSVWAPSRLIDGRCCGRKTHPYKRELRAGPGSCCFKCGREYGLDGEQRPNWAYNVDGDGNYHRYEPLGNAHE
jgi:hypothetical protein